MHCRGTGDTWEEGALDAWEEGPSASALQGGGRMDQVLLLLMHLRGVGEQTICLCISGET